MNSDESAVDGVFADTIRITIELVMSIQYTNLQITKVAPTNYGRSYFVHVKRISESTQSV